MLSKRLEDNGGEPWQDCFEYQSDIHFKTVQVTTKRKAHLEIGDAIKKMRNEEKDKPLVLVVQSQATRMLSHEIPIMQEFPIVGLKADETDKQLPPLGWQSFVAKKKSLLTT